MKADEYDLLLDDPSDYMLRVNTPRSAKLFESFAKLPPLRMMQPAAHKESPLVHIAGEQGGP